MMPIWLIPRSSGVKASSFPSGEATGRKAMEGPPSRWPRQFSERGADGDHGLHPATKAATSNAAALVRTHGASRRKPADEGTVCGRAVSRDPLKDSSANARSRAD